MRGVALDGMSGRCLACQAELRPEARFCPRCGQRAVAMTPDPAEPPAITALARPPVPEPETAPAGSGDWDDWYTITPPRPAPGPRTPSPQAPPPRSYPPARPRPYRAALPAVPQHQPYPAYPPHPPPVPPPGSVPLQRRPAQPPASGPLGYQPWRPYDPAGPPRRGNRGRSGSNAGLWTILLLLLACVGAGLAVLVTHPFANHSPRQAANTAPAPSARTTHRSGSAVAASPGSASAAAAGAEQRAASDVASMLSRSAAERSAIIGTAAAIANCGPGLTGAPAVFGDAAASRRTMLARLAAMPGRNALPPALLRDLTQAWQASVAADRAYATWASDEISHGCVRNDTSDPGYQAAGPPDRQASQYKDAFVTLWNPVASGYGLTQYSASQF